LNDKFGNCGTEAVLPDFYISSARHSQRITTNCSHGSRQQGLESNSDPPECEADMQTTMSQFWVKLCW